MKKFLIVCAILFFANVACKKTDGGGGLCGCSPVEGPEFNLVIKNNAGVDLLNTGTAGAYTTDQILLYRKESGDKITPVVFAIRPPFSYGDEKFGYNFLHTKSIRWNQATMTDVIYLKIGNEEPYELSLQLKPEGRYSVNKLLINQKEAEKGGGNLAKFVSVYYLNK